MAAFHSRIRALAVAAGAFALVVVGAGSTIAASTPATLYACYNVYGQASITDINMCKLSGGGRLVPINAAGVPGPTGATGATGATGPTGPQGPAIGAAGFMDHYQYTIPPMLPGETPYLMSLNCDFPDGRPLGYHAISGWLNLGPAGDPDLGRVVVTNTGPQSGPAVVFPTTVPTGWNWHVEATAPMVGPLTADAYIICVP